MHSRATPCVAIIAYGNPLRSDDGIGWHAAEILRKELDSVQVEVVCVHQLTPDIAANLADADGVIFLDAAQTGEPGEIRCARVEANESGQQFSHSLSPGQVLALADHLYGKQPDAFMVSVAGESFDHGDALSETLQSALPALVRTVVGLIARLAPRFDSSDFEARNTCVRAQLPI
ncbi:MAG TPA: hydrogenase maturation protease [Terracidiphilus sp.]|nr:hydrogenase maturation protease [Terracidiphilus sp.]